MAEVTELRGVPQDRVGNQVQQAIILGATKVECERQPDGQWTVRTS